jgi:hypothetical protein
MLKKYIVKLKKKERKICNEVIARLSGSSQKVRRAQILRQADVNGPGWTDEKIAAAYHCRTRTVETLRKRLVEEGFSVALNGIKRVTPPRSCILDGEQEAKLIATRLGSPPKGFGSWSLRLLAEQVIALEITDAISYETCRKVLKKTA